MGKLTVTTRDLDGEVSTVNFPIADLTTGNIVAQMAAGDALVAALEDITACLLTKKQYVAKVSPLAGETKSSNTEAHREAAWLVRYHDDTTFERATLQIPGPLAADQDGTNPKIADLADTEIAAFVTAFEAVVLPPGGNTAVVDEMIWVGRNT